MLFPPDNSPEPISWPFEGNNLLWNFNISFAHALNPWLTLYWQSCSSTVGPKVHSGFAARYYGKTQTNFLANPIHCHENSGPAAGMLGCCLCLRHSLRLVFHAVRSVASSAPSCAHGVVQLLPWLTEPVAHARRPPSSPCSPGGQLVSKFTGCSTSRHEDRSLTSWIFHPLTCVLILSNSATSPPLSDDGESCSTLCDCFAVAEMVSKPQVALPDTPWDNLDWLLFCDGACQWDFWGNMLIGDATASPLRLLRRLL